MPVTYKEALKMAEAMDMVLIPYENAENMAHTRQGCKSELRRA